MLYLSCFLSELLSCGCVYHAGFWRCWGTSQRGSEEHGQCCRSVMSRLHPSGGRNFRPGESDTVSIHHLETDCTRLVNNLKTATWKAKLKGLLLLRQPHLVAILHIAFKISGSWLITVKNISVVESLLRLQLVMWKTLKLIHADEKIWVTACAHCWMSVMYLNNVSLPLNKNGLVLSFTTIYFFGLIQFICRILFSALLPGLLMAKYISTKPKKLKHTSLYVATQCFLNSKYISFLCSG